MTRKVLLTAFIIELVLGCRNAASSGSPEATRQSVASVDAAAPADAGTAADAESDAGPPTECPAGAPGQAMVEFETPGGLRYCMDQTEVTQSQYADFLAAKVSPEAQLHPHCDGEKNADFAPRVDNPCRAGAQENLDDVICSRSAYDPEAKADEPVVCVNFCDAVAYCSWAGKRLCGVPGRRNVTLGDPSDAASDFNRGHAPELSHWFNACSSGGSSERAYPAGFDIERCAGPTRAGSRSECRTEGKTGDAYDLMGGVGEWQDSCADNRACRVLGGMSGVGVDRGTCAQKPNFPAGYANRWTGFRCCLDLDPKPGEDI